MRELVIPELTVLFLKDTVPKDKKIMCTIELGTSPDMQPFQMIVDTGSSVSLLPAEVYENSFCDIPLKQTEIPLVTYSRQGIPVLGQLERNGYMMDVLLQPHFTL